MSDNKITLKELLLRHNKVIIPDIQRDYVLGSGNSKLEHLFENMEKANGSFEFSCVLAHKDENNNVFIYDGQQRLATLAYLCAKIAYENKDAEVQNLLQRFEFKGRDLANQWIAKPDQIAKEQAVDFTTYSAAELIETFEKRMQSPQYDSKEKLTLDFFFEKVKFNLLFIKEVSDSEQFFMDVNDGLDLKEYEIYKAELYHHAKRILGEEFKEFALKMENEWLEFFLKYKEERVYEEEVLVQFLKYCFRMMWIEDSKDIKGYRENDISWIEESHLRKIENIVDGMIGYMKLNGEHIGLPTCIEYSLSRLGGYWNITDKNYNAILSKFIKNLQKTEEIEKDVVVWCFLSSLYKYIDSDKNIENLYNYLRFVKKLLNNIRSKNTETEMLHGGSIENHKLEFIYYNVKCIPTYYDFYSDKIRMSIEDKLYLQAIILSNKNIIIEDSQCYAEQFLKICVNKTLKEILSKEKEKFYSPDREIIEKYENLPFTNGLVDKFMRYNESGYCLEDWTSILTPDKLKNICSEKDYRQYKSILKFISNYGIKWEDCLAKSILIKWKPHDYYRIGKQKIVKDRECGDIYFHTWYDFFTNSCSLKFETKADRKNECLVDLPDGWFKGDILYQVAETEAASSDGGFAVNNPPKGSRTIELFDLSCFEQNFSSISKNEQGGYLINKKPVESLPDFLERYNGNAGVDKLLSTTDRIYYPCAKYDGYVKDYLNKVLLGKYRRLWDSEEKFNEYLKENEGKLQPIEMDGVHYFVKLTS